MEIRDRTFLVTGGASGLGRAAAQAILAAGGNAVLLDVNADTGRAAETALGAHARFAQADVTNEEQVTAAVELAHSSFGGLHGVINAAGIGPAAKVIGKNGVHPLDLFERTIRVNLVGTFNVIRLTAVRLVQNEPQREWRAGSDRQYCVNCRVRRADRSAGLCCIEGRHCRPDPADRARVCVQRHQGRDGRTWYLRYTTARGLARSRPVRRSVSRFLFRRDSADPTNTRRSCVTSSRTRC